MNFKDLENAVSGEVVLVDKYGVERLFLGFAYAKDRVVTERIKTGELSSWCEEIVDRWTIKQPVKLRNIERAIHCYSESSAISLYNKDSRRFYFEDKCKSLGVCKNALNRKVKGLADVFIDLDTFEIVEPTKEEMERL